MGAGKPLAIVGGILTLAATFALALFQSGSDYGWGLGFAIDNLITMFVDAASYNVAYGDFFVYIFAGVFILFLISGILQLIGVKSRATAIIGSILPLGLGVFILLGGFGIIPAGWDFFLVFLEGAPLFEPFFPFFFEIPVVNISIGTIVLLVGGLLGLISGFMSRWD